MATVTTVVITGGTDGMGAALTRHYLRRGDQVVVVGRSEAKFDALLASLVRDGAPSSVAERACFVGADLSLVSDTELLAEWIKARYDRIDALVLAASFVRRKRHVTSEGREASWVLFFVSKFVLVSRLAGLLAAADRPVVVNTSVPGAKADAINFDDLELADGFTFAKSNAQQRRANELLGLLVTEQSKISYVTWGPRRLVKTSFAGDLGPVMKFAVAILALVLGQRAVAAVQPVAALVAEPPVGRTAYRGAKQVSLVTGPDDAGDARRLTEAIDGVEEGRR